MKKVEQIVLDEKDKELLKGMIPTKPWEYDHHDFGFMGSPATREYDEAVKPYKDAGLLEYMEAKRAIYHALNNRIKFDEIPITDFDYQLCTLPFDLARAIEEFLDVVPENVAMEMGINIPALKLYAHKIQGIKNEITNLQSDLRNDFDKPDKEMSGSNVGGLRGMFANASGDKKDLPGDVIS